MAAVRQPSPGSRLDTRTPRRSCAPAASARAASARSNATRSITVASGDGVVYSTVRPAGPTHHPPLSPLRPAPPPRATPPHPSPPPTPPPRPPPPPTPPSSPLT